MCLGHNEHPNYPFGRRCPACSPAGRREGRRAKALYGELTKETRAMVAALPMEFQSGGIHARSRCASASTDPLVIKAALGDNPGVLRGLAKNPNLTPEDAEKLAAQVSWFDRTQMVRANADRPEILAVLATDHDPRVREHVVAAKAVDGNTMTLLSKDESPRVAALAKGLTVDTDQLGGFLEDTSIPLSVRRQILSARAEREGKQIWDQAADSKNAELRSLAAANTADKEIRNELLADKTASVAASALNNANFVSPLAGMSEDALSGAGSLKARKRLAVQSSDPSILARLMSDPDESLQKMATMNPFMPIHALESKAPTLDEAAVELYERSYYGKMSEMPVGLRPSFARVKAIHSGDYALDDALNDLNPDVVAAAKEFSGQRTLKDLVTADATADRLQALDHPGANRDVVRGLLNDPDPQVREKAASQYEIKSVEDIDKYPAILESIKASKGDLLVASDVAGKLVSHTDADVKLLAIRHAYPPVYINEEFLSAHPERAGDLLEATDGIYGYTPQQLLSNLDRMSVAQLEEATNYVDHPDLLSMRSKQKKRSSRMSAAKNALTPAADLRRMAASKYKPLADTAKATLSALNPAAPVTASAASKAPTPDATPVKAAARAAARAGEAPPITSTTSTDAEFEAAAARMFVDRKNADAAGRKRFAESPIESLTGSTSVAERRKAFFHPKFDNSTAITMMADPDKWIRRSAATEFSVESVADVDRHPAILELMSDPDSTWKTDDQKLAKDLTQHSDPWVKLAGIRSMDWVGGSVNKQFLAAHPERAGDLAGASKSVDGFAPDQLVRHWNRLSEESRKKAVDRGGHPFLMSLKSKRAGGSDRREAAASVLTPVEDLTRLAASKNGEISSIAKKTLLALKTA